MPHKTSTRTKPATFTNTYGTFTVTFYYDDDVDYDDGYYPGPDGSPDATRIGVG
jgi:hypothetical protein